MEPELNFEKRYRLVREVIETLVLTLLMFLIIRLAVQNFNVDGHSMEPNLHNTELILVDKWSYLFHQPARGDVIVFDAPPQPGQDYVKRIIGLPGDTITVHNTTVFVNGKQLTESYIDPRLQGNPFPAFANRTVVVPQDALFVLGDNRNGSSDSRDWGCVPLHNLVGRAALIYWPLGQDNNGFLPSVTATFNDVPPPNGQTGNACPIIRQPNTQAAMSSDKTEKPVATESLFIVTLPALFVLFSHRKKKRTSAIH